MTNNKVVKIIDCTLREGNQAPTVKFSIENSIEIASQLNLCKVDMIEIGHPSASQKEFDRVRSVVNLKLPIPILSHARAKQIDIEAVASSGASWVGIFVGINTVSQRSRLNRREDQILEIIRTNVLFAKNLGLKVRYTVEDSSRTPADLLMMAYDTALNAGADRICYSDTVGVLEPQEVNKIIFLLREQFSATEIEVHFHDDRGLAMANALMAVESGANWVSTSVNGLGERCGITDTCAFVANIAYKKIQQKAILKNVLQLSEVVQNITHSPVDFRRPITGKNVFTHKAKLHIDAIKKEKNAYNWIDPKWLGLNNKFDTA